MSVWVVGRDDGGCYVEQSDAVGGGTTDFATEREAVEYAIMCEIDAIEPLRRSLKTLRSRLRRVKRATSQVQS